MDTRNKKRTLARRTQREIKWFVRGMIRRQSGQDLVEYTLLMCFVVLCSLALAAVIHG